MKTSRIRKRNKSNISGKNKFKCFSSKLSKNEKSVKFLNRKKGVVTPLSKFRNQKFLGKNESNFDKKRKTLPKEDFVQDESIKKLLEIMNSQKWYNISMNDFNCYSVTNTFKNIEDACFNIRKEANELIPHLSSYTQSNKTSIFNDSLIKNKILKEGTWSDRISASSILIKENVLLNTKSLRFLISQTTIETRRIVIISLTALKDLFLNDLLPSNRKLLYLKDNIYLNGQVNNVNKNSNGSHIINEDFPIVISYSKADILIWWLEDFIKSLFASYILVLSKSIQNSLNQLRHISFEIIFNLLNSIPEQERALLTILVSELKISKINNSKVAFYFLKKLLKHHPAFKQIIVSSILNSIEQTILSSTEIKNSFLHSLSPAFSFIIKLNYTKNDPLTNQIIKNFLIIFNRVMEQIKKLQSDEHAPLLKKDRRKKRKKRKRKMDINTNINNLDESKLSTQNSDILLSPDSKFFRFFLNGIQKLISYCNPSEIKDIFIGTDILCDIINTAKNNSVKISCLSLLNRLINIFHLDSFCLFELLHSLFFDLNVFESSNRVILVNILSELSKYTKDINDKIKQRSLSLIRRALHLSSHYFNTSLQLNMLTNFVNILASSNEFDISIFKKSDLQLIQDELEDDIKPTDVLDSSMVSSVRYNPAAENINKVNSSSAFLWEFNLLQCSVIPSVALYSTLFFDSLQTNNITQKSFQNQIQHLIPLSYIKFTPSIFTFSSEFSSASHILDLLILRKEKISHISKKKYKKNQDNQKSKQEVIEHDFSLNSYSVTPSKEGFPHERFYSQYMENHSHTTSLHDYTHMESESKFDDASFSDISSDMSDDISAYTSGSDF